VEVARLEARQPSRPDISEARQLVRVRQILEPGELPPVIELEGFDRAPGDRVDQIIAALLMQGMEHPNELSSHLPVMGAGEPADRFAAG
jgi:hypothetical protein